MKRAIVILGTVAMLAACGEREPDMQPVDPRKWEAQGQQTYAAPAYPDRFVVVRAVTFKDELAYGDKRGVYVITDKETGKEYVGVSGIGIAETGSHRSGKTTRTDER